MIDMTRIKSRLNSLSNNNAKSDLLWKPVAGKQVVRIVPYKFNPQLPFIELKFHYGLNGKTYLSPDSFNRPDPIVEFSNKMKRSGDKEEWQFGKKIEPKMRTYVPVIIREQESEGVKFWGFGKQVYQEILSIISDPDYGDITDPVNGRDIVVEFKTVEETGKQYPETTIRVKPNPSPAVDANNKELLAKLGAQTNILDLFPEPTYDELKNVMTAWLHQEESPEATVAVAHAASVEPTAASVADVTTPEESALPKTNQSADAEEAFKKLFGN